MFPVQLVRETGARNQAADVASFEDFDRYVEERGIAEEDLPQAFAHWLANLAGHPMTGEPVDVDGPTFTPEPEGG
jgi:hypothetical protein